MFPSSSLPRAGPWTLRGDTGYGRFYVVLLRSFASLRGLVTPLARHFALIVACPASLQRASHAFLVLVHPLLQPLCFSVYTASVPYRVRACGKYVLLFSIDDGSHSTLLLVSVVFSAAYFGFVFPSGQYYLWSAQHRSVLLWTLVSGDTSHTVVFARYARDNYSCC